MILFIDNYDSFVYNLARYFKLLNCSIIVKRNDEITIAKAIELKPQAIVISPGPGKPRDAGISLDIIKHFYNKIPILGVCLGHQAIAAVFGANVTYAKLPMHGKVSMITHYNSKLFNKIANHFNTGRYHSLIVEAIDVDSELKITATSPENEIMALEHKVYPVFGIQFHPESILTPEGVQIIKNFIDFL